MEDFRKEYFMGSVKFQMHQLQCDYYIRFITKGVKLFHLKVPNEVIYMITLPLC